MQNTTTNTAPLPQTLDGLTVETVAPNRLGLCFRAVCDAHDYCRQDGGRMRWMADSWEDFTLRVTPAFLQHCQDMNRYA